MIVDCEESRRALGGVAPAGPKAAPDLFPAAPGDDFVRALWVACGLPGAPLQVSAAAAADLPADGWHAVIVSRGGTASPYDALRALTSRGEALPGPVACLTLDGGCLQGQHGRRWAALPGNLHLSVALPCDLDAARCAPSLPMLPGVALAEAAIAMTGPHADTGARPGLKWVNDLVLAEADGSWRKVGGVLTAARTTGARISTVFLGLGLNLVAAPPLPSDPFALPPAALAGRLPAGAVPTLGAAAGIVLARVRERLALLATAGPAGLVAAYRNHALVLGREVAVWAADAGRDGSDPGPPRRRGTVVDILPDLALVLAGQPEPVREGRLRLADPPAIP